MNEFLIGIRNASNTERTTAFITAYSWLDALNKAMDTYRWAFYGEVLAQNGQHFDRSGKFHI